MSSTYTLKPTLRLPTKTLYPSMTMGSKSTLKRKNDTKDSSYMYGDKGKEDDKGEEPVKKKEYSRGEQVDQFTVFLKPNKRSVLQWFAYRSSGADEIKYKELIVDLIPRGDNYYQLVINRSFINRRGLSSPKIKLMLDQIKNVLGVEFNIPSQPNFTSVSFVSKKDPSPILENFLNAKESVFSIGGVATLWGDYYPFYDPEYIQRIFFDRDVDEQTKRDIQKYQAYIEENKIPYVDESQSVDQPSFGCLPDVGEVILRGSCNSSGTFIDLVANKRKFQGFVPVFNYMPDVNVIEKIKSYMGQEEQEKMKYIPSSNQFSFDFKANLSMNKLPYFLVCDFMYSFYHLVNSSPEVKVALRENPVSCSDMNTCLPYFSKDEVIRMGKQDKLINIMDYQVNDLDAETDSGKRCRVQTFGTTDEYEQWKTNAKDEKDWFFQDKKLVYEPRVIKKGQEILSYQDALDLLSDDEKEEIIKLVAKKQREARGYK